MSVFQDDKDSNKNEEDGEESEVFAKNWIEFNFFRRECLRYVREGRDTVK
jgi:hypothetical protein